MSSLLSWFLDLAYPDQATLICVSQVNSELCHKSIQNFASTGKLGLILTHMPIDATRLQDVLHYIPSTIRVQRLLTAAERDWRLMNMHYFENLVRIQLCLQHFSVKSATLGCPLREILRLLLQTFHTAKEYPSSRREKHYSVDVMADFVVASMPPKWHLEDNLATDVSRGIQHLAQTYRYQLIDKVDLGGLLELICISAKLPV